MISIVTELISKLGIPIVKKVFGIKNTNGGNAQPERVQPDVGLTPAAQTHHYQFLKLRAILRFARKALNSGLWIVMGGTLLYLALFSPETLKAIWLPLQDWLGDGSGLLKN